MCDRNLLGYWRRQMGEDSDDERAPERVPRVLIFCCKGVFSSEFLHVSNSNNFVSIF